MVISTTVSSIGPTRVRTSSSCPNAELCMHCVYSVAISDNSALNFIEIIVLIRWIGTQPQIRMGVGSKAFHAGWGA